MEGVFGGEGITVYTGTKLLDAHCVGNQKEIVFEHRANEVQSPRSKVQSPDRPSLRVGHQLQSSRAEVQSQDGPSLRDGRSGTVRVQADEIFFALGRIPNIASLGLEKAGVQLEYNRIATNSRMQTSVPHIYAAGDCAGLHEIVHIAVRQGEVAAHNIANPERPKEMDSRLLIEVIFTEPQIATVGLTEKRADVENIPYVVASYPFIDHGKSLIMEAKDGFVKLLADPIGGEILGGCCVGPQGGELIHEIVAAMSKRMTVQELAEMPHYHPTLAEIWTYPAEELAEKVASRASSANQR
ncbi:MAG: hypothetical protein C5B50_12455 [Verrucomicrobia bacterium]|nr:MAG: hypothetical protein C5B50_12455 [Verrucomicrobiota bacterium]